MAREVADERGGGARDDARSRAASRSRAGSCGRAAARRARRRRGSRPSRRRRGCSGSVSPSTSAELNAIERPSAAIESMKPAGVADQDACARRSGGWRTARHRARAPDGREQRRAPPSARAAPESGGRASSKVGWLDRRPRSQTTFTLTASLRPVSRPPRRDRRRGPRRSRLHGRTAKCWRIAKRPRGARAAPSDRAARRSGEWRPSAATTSAARTSPWAVRDHGPRGVALDAADRRAVRDRRPRARRARRAIASTSDRAADAEAAARERQRRARVVVLDETDAGEGAACVRRDLVEHAEALERADRGRQQALAARLVGGKASAARRRARTRRDRRRRSPPPGPPGHRRRRRRRAPCRRDASVTIAAARARRRSPVPSRAARRVAGPRHVGVEEIAGDEEHRRGREVADLGERLPRARERVGRELERLLHRAQHLRAAGVRDPVPARRGGGARARRGSRRRRRAARARMRSGMPPVRTTRKPVSSISQPMISSVSGKKSERDATTRGPRAALRRGRRRSAPPPRRRRRRARSR